MSDSHIMAALAEPRIGLGEITSRLDRLDNGQNQIRVAIMDRIERLENRLTEQHDDTTVAMGSGGLAERIAENTREILLINTGVLNTVTHKPQRLQTQMQELLEKKPDA